MESLGRWCSVLRRVVFQYLLHMQEHVLEIILNTLIITRIFKKKILLVFIDQKLS